MNRRLTILAVVVLTLLVPAAAGCTGSAQEPGPAVRVLETEKTLPEDFYERAENGMLVFGALDGESFDALREEYRLSGAAAEVDWDRQGVLFLGVFESGSCPLHFVSARLSEEEDGLIVRLAVEDDSVPCTDDATPRTFVLGVDRAVVSGLRTVSLEDYHGSSPTVPVFLLDR